MNKIKRFLIGAAASAMILANSVMPAGAVVTLTNGSFESGTNPGTFLTVAAGGTDITGWTVDSGSVDYIGTYWQSSDGVRNIDLNGNAKGSISQVITTTVGATYTVTFSLSGNPDGGPFVKTVNVSATGTAATPFTFDTAAGGGNNHADMKWASKQYVFVATATSTTLTFASQDEGSYGAAIDKVAIAEDLSTVPTVTITPTQPAGTPAECAGMVFDNVIQGTSGSDILNGTAGRDLILAKGGSDVVDGKGGNDCIDGGEGSNLLKGGADNDVIVGGSGSDSIKGEGGNDKLYGNGGSDAISGGAGNDNLWGAAGSDSLNGDGDVDTADGGAGSDSCSAETLAQCNP